MLENLESPAEALPLFLKAAEQGTTRGYRAAAVLLDEGRGVEKDAEAAAEYLLEGLGKDNNEVLNELANDSRNWSQDTRRAIQTRPAEAGYHAGAIDAQFGPQMVHALKQWRMLGPPSSS